MQRLKDQESARRQDCRKRESHADNSKSEILLDLADPERMGTSAEQQREAMRVHQPVRKTFQLHESDQEQCKRGVFGKIRVGSHGSQ
jgi:hypothetical protein